MALVLSLGFVLCGQAPGATLDAFFPLRAGDVYTYWCEYGQSRESLTMRVLESSGTEATVEGFPVPAQFVAGEPAGATLKVTADTAAGVVRCLVAGADEPFFSLAPDATAKPGGTWAADYPAVVTGSLAPAGELRSGTVILAQGVGIVAINFTTADGSGEYVLIAGPKREARADTVPTIVTLTPNTSYWYARRDLLGKVQAVCEAGDPVEVGGLPGVRVTGLPWFDQAGARPLTARERRVAIDIPGRRWMEELGGEARELFQFNVAPCDGPVVVPAGRFEGCYRLRSARPGFEAVIEPATGFLSWHFDTILGPVDYELVRVTPRASGDASAPAGVEPDTPVVGPADEPTAPVTPPSLPPRRTEGQLSLTTPGRYVAATGGTVYRCEADSRGMVAVGPGLVTLVAASADGKSVAWVRAESAARTLQCSSAAVAAVPVLTHSPNEGEIDNLQWSPDGTRLLFTAGTEVRVYTPASGDTRVIGRGTRPLWLSDTAVLYEVGSEATDEEVGIVRQPLDGGAATIYLPWAFGASVAASGNVIAFASPRYDDDPRLYVLEGGQQTEVPRSTRFDRDPTLSPDGRFLAYVRYDAAEGVRAFSVRIVDRSSGDEHELVARSPSWPRVAFGSDGTLICAATSPDGQPLRLLVPSPSAQPVPITVEGAPPSFALPFGAPARRG